MKDNNSHNSTTHYMPLFMSIGISVGLAIGAAVQNIAPCMSIGLGVGLCIGAVLDRNGRQKSDSEKADNSEKE